MATECRFGLKLGLSAGLKELNNPWIPMRSESASTFISFVPNVLVFVGGKKNVQHQQFSYRFTFFGEVNRSLLTGLRSQRHWFPLASVEERSVASVTSAVFELQSVRTSTNGSRRVVRPVRPVSDG